MAPTLVSVDEYLCTSYPDGDCEYVDGEIVERNVGEIDHASVQSRVAVYLLTHYPQFWAAVAVRVQVQSSRIRVPDVTLVAGPRPAGRIVTAPAQEKIDDYLAFGIPYVWVVNPRNDTLENLVAYLSHYAVEYFQNTSIECELRLPPELPAWPLSSEARHNLFLTFEETLNNVLKHSNATHVKVTMSVDGHEFELAVADNGRGFDADSLLAAKGDAGTGRRGNGLHNMRQRLTVLDGTLSVTSNDGGGTTVTMRLHLNRHSPH